MNLFLRDVIEYYGFFLSLESSELFGVIRPSCNKITVVLVFRTLRVWNEEAEGCMIDLQL